MVYRGRTSLGCALCRKRKIKCDTQKPQCGQCIKYGETCPGYPKLDERIFLDQTEDVRAKVEREVNQNTSNQGRFLFDPVAHTTLPCRQITAGIDDRALNHFYYAFGTMNHLGFLSDTDGFFDADNLLGVSTRSIALLGFAYRFGSPFYIQVARRRYATALNLVNETLQDFQRAKTPETLLAIHFLSLFESIDCRESNRLSSYYAHAKGYLAIIRQMNTKDLLHPLVPTFFDQCIRPVLFICGVGQKPVPQFFVNALDYVYENSDKQTPFEPIVYRLWKLTIRFLNFRVAIKSDNVSDVANIIMKCLDFDMEFDKWYDDATMHHASRRLKKGLDLHVGQNIAWKGMYYSYPTYTVAWSWLHYYGTRNLLNYTYDTYLRKYNRGRVVNENLRLAKMRVEIQDDICASVPWLLGHCGNKHVLTFAGLNVMSGLFYAGKSIILLVRNDMDLCDVEFELSRSEEKAKGGIDFIKDRRMRAQMVHWMIGRLECVSESFGFRHASVLARDLQKDWQRTFAPWAGSCDLSMQVLEGSEHTLAEDLFDPT